MKVRAHTYLAIVAGMLLALALAACGAGSPQAAAGEPTAVVASFYQLINANKVPEAMRLTADDYVMNDPTGTYDRTTAAQQWQGVVDAGLTFEQSNLVNTDGRVTSCYLVRQNGSQVDKGCDNVTHVRAGKIIFDGLQSAENIWVVQRYYERLNARDIDSAGRFVADDALFINPTGRYAGKAAIVASLGEQAKGGLSFDLSNFREQGGRVAYDYVVKVNGEPVEKGSDGVTKVKDGKIVFDGTAATEPAQ